MIIGSSLSGDTLFSLSGCDRNSTYGEARARISRTLGINDEHLTLYENGQPVENAARIGGLEQVVAKMIVHHKVDVNELLARNIAADELLAADLTMKKLKTAGATGDKLLAVGFTVADLKQGGFEVAELVALGSSVTDLKEAGFGAEELYRNYFDPRALRNAGFSAREMRKGWFQCC
jgi:hypothetical protein